MPGPRLAIPSKLLIDNCSKILRCHYQVSSKKLEIRILKSETIPKSEFLKLGILIC